MSPLILDTEITQNHLLILMMDAKTKVLYRFERFNDIECGPYDRQRLMTMLATRPSVGCNSNLFDEWIISAYLAGFTNAQIFAVCEFIIHTELGGYRAAKEFDLQPLQWHHYDVMPVAPLIASLKVYAGRLHAPTIQDLPFVPGTLMTEEKRRETMNYCANDLHCTLLLFKELLPQIKLRQVLGRQYGMNLTSKSDPQISEGVLRREIKLLTGAEPRPKTLVPKTHYTYSPPTWLVFDEPVLRSAYWRAVRSSYPISPAGKLHLPEALMQPVHFKGRTYKTGIGGLHSQEKKQTIIVGPGEHLYEQDISSMYPSIILNEGWAPSTIGEGFTKAYRAIVEQRLAAKKAGDKVTADSLKIVVNASYGKFSNQYSSLFDPSVLLHVVLTGQLALLYLIELIENHTNATVVSANTDSVLVYAKHRQRQVGGAQAGEILGEKIRLDPGGDTLPDDRSAGREQLRGGHPQRQAEAKRRFQVARPLQESLFHSQHQSRHRLPRPRRRHRGDHTRQPRHPRLRGPTKSDRWRPVARPARRRNRTLVSRQGWHTNHLQHIRQ